MLKVDHQIIELSLLIRAIRVSNMKLRISCPKEVQTKAMKRMRSKKKLYRKITGALFTYDHNEFYTNAFLLGDVAYAQ